MKKKTTTKPKVEETPEAKVAEIEKGLVPLTAEAQKIVIKTVDDVKGATSFLAKVKGYSVRVLELQKFFTDPYIEQRRVALKKKQEIEALFAPKLKPLEDIITNVKRAIADFTLEEERKARVEEARLEKIRLAADKKREESGKEQIIEPVKSVERAAPTVKTAEGRTTTRKVWKYEIVDDEALLGNPYFNTKLILFAREHDLHNKLLRQMVKDGERKVNGVRIYEDIEVSVSSN